MDIATAVVNCAGPSVRESFASVLTKDNNTAVNLSGVGADLAGATVGGIAAAGGVASGLMAGLTAFLTVLVGFVLPMLLWVGAMYLSLSCYKHNGAQIGAFLVAFFLPVFYLIFYLVYHVVTGHKCAK